MIESYKQAVEEFKRVDHLFHVSLKYTRTVDVIKIVIERLINAYDFGIEALLRFSKSKKKVASIPTAPLARAETLKNTFSEDQQLINYLNLYILFRKIKKAKFNRALEYRRHVTMTAFLDEGEVEISIDIISEYFEKTKEFIDYCEVLVGVKND